MSFKKLGCFVFLLVVFRLSLGLPFNIVPNGPLPTVVVQGYTTTAAYTVSNLTGEQRNNTFVKYLPPNVTIQNTGCGSTFSLAPTGQAGSSCILNLLISGPVDASDPLPSHHLFICFPGGKACAGTDYPLNVSQSSVNYVVSIAVTPSAAIIVQGETQQFTATATYLNGTTQDITSSATWSSDNPSAITIDASTGLATAQSSGTATLTATFQGISGSATARVIGINSIAVTPTSANISIGNTRQFTATATLADSTTADVTATATWNSSNTSAATINSSGLATGVATGSTNITAMQGGITSNTAVATVVSYLFFTQGSNDHTVNSLYRCNISSNLTTLSSCVEQTNVSALTGGASSFRGIAFNPAGTYGYVADITGNQIIYCQYSTSSTWTSCSAMAGESSGGSSSGFRLPVNIAFSSDGGTAYVTNFIDNNISKCVVNGSTGAFTSCTRLPDASFDNPTGIAINSSGTYAYIADFSNAKISICQITVSGFNACTTISGTAATPQQVVFNPPQTKLYLGNENGTLTINYYSISGSDGSLTSLGTTGSGTSLNPDGLYIHPVGTAAYIGNFNPGSNPIFYCAVNTSTGAFSSCATAGVNFSYVFGLYVH